MALLSLILHPKYPRQHVPQPVPALGLHKRQHQGQEFGDHAAVQPQVLETIGEAGQVAQRTDLAAEGGGETSQAPEQAATGVRGGLDQLIDLGNGRAQLAKITAAELVLGQLEQQAGPALRLGLVDAELDDATIASFQKELGAMGYRFQFITLAGFHALNATMFELAGVAPDAANCSVPSLPGAITSTECTKRRKAPEPVSSYWRRADRFP